MIKTRPRGYKTFFFILNSVEHEIFSANKYENANNSWHFHIYEQRNVHAQLCLVTKILQLLVIWNLLAGQISCSAELSMKKKSFITSGPDSVINSWKKLLFQSDFLKTRLLANDSM